MRSHLEYANSVSYPKRKTDIDKLERVHKRATKLIPEMSNKSYSDRLKNSNLPVCHTPILYQLNTAKRRITQTTPRDSAGTLAFRRQVSLVEDPFPEVCTQSDPPPSENADFDRFRLIVLQP